MSNERLKKQFTREIDQLATILANGWNLQSISEQYPQDAPAFQYLWSTLDTAGLISAVETKRDAILKERARQQSIAPHPIQSNRQSYQSDQENFFSIIPDEHPPYPIAPKKDSIERALDGWHKIFNGRGPSAKRAREKLLAPDASHEYRQFLQYIGYSPKQKNERLRQKTKTAIDRLIDSGVMSMLYSKVTRSEQMQMVAILKEYDAKQKELLKAWESSDELSR